MSSSSSLARGFTIPRIAVIFCLVLGIYLFRDTWLPVNIKDHAAPIPPTTPPAALQQPDSTHLTSGDSISPMHAESCRTVPGADKIMLVLKTGATELYEKLPTHFVTLFTCVPHFLIFSDLAQTFGETPVHDAIAPVSPRYREHHKDFELYRKLQEYQQSGQDMSLLKGDGGWNLDKWKFLPMMQETFAKTPKHIEWFLYMEADTSVSWTNLLQFVKTMDPKETYYGGSQNVIGGVTFAHGGSGYLVSRAAHEQLALKRETEGPEVYDSRWEDNISKSCCGDEIVARALLEAGVKMTMAWPKIQGETVSSIDWTRRHWCTPSVTHHHVSPIEIDALWQFQTEWVNEHGWNIPYLHHDLFDRFVARHISVTRKDWNNVSKDKKIVPPGIKGSQEAEYIKLPDFERKGVESQALCEAACLANKEEDCIQWMYSPGRCYLGKVIRFGKSDERDDEHWVSGWIPERVQKYRESFKGCPKITW